jgi:cytochrome c oxidase subunit 2
MAPDRREGAFLSPAIESESKNTMKFGEFARAVGRSAKALGLSLALFAAPQVVMAQAPAAASSAAPAATPAAAASPAAAAALPNTPHFAVAPGAYVPMTPTPGKGMPVDGGIGFQTQYSPTGQYALWMHNDILMPLITIISLFVLLLIVIVIARYNSRANPTPSRTSHNTVIEVVWTLVPVLILVGIAIPSMDLLAKQYKPAPANALTVKVTGNQWFWTYSYPDNGGFEVVSNMLNVPGQPVVNNGVREQGSKPYDGPAHLEVDNRMVVPVGEPIRIQTTGADVIHSFAVPALWFKLDAVPGRINEKVLFVKEPGVYYGQCSELCGARHGYMPIAVEALPRAQFNAWVLSHSGGAIDGVPKAPQSGAAPSAAASAKPAA